jgi:predicted NAD/FAD-binding protein
VIAVVGSGISGLAAAWLLSRIDDVVIFERESRLGGHTHTHHFDTPDGPLALDTGFLVHNDRTYPLLVRLFDEIGVETYESDMSFAVTDPATGFEYGTRNLNSLFADRRNLVRPGHYRLLAGMLRFGRSARATADEAVAPDVTLERFLDEHAFGGEVVDRFLLPLAAAIWSASPGAIRTFPALTLLRFFRQHGMDTVLDHPRWRTVRGGAATYIPKLLASPRIRVETGAALRRITRTPAAVELEFDTRQSVSADHVVLACHGDEVLPLLGDPQDDERAVFSAFGSTTNHACLHTDASFLPKRPAARASWNYQLGADGAGATVTYHLNRLQGLHGARREYCVTLNPSRPIDPSRVLARMVYTHPLYTREAVAAQARWADVSGRNRIHYCGAYWYYGFHEDGLRSAVRVAAALGVSW